MQILTGVHTLDDKYWGSTDRQRRKRDGLAISVREGVFEGLGGGHDSVLHVKSAQGMNATVTATNMRAITQ